MVPPIYLGNQVPIVRVGDQNTYVFFKDGVETFVIRPGYQGKVDEFGMLIPMPSVPALRKVSDNVFPHVRAAVDPPEVVVDLRFRRMLARSRRGAVGAKGAEKSDGLAFDKRKQVRVVKEEAVGMYEVAVLEAGSSAALKKWMGEHGYKYPEGMDKACDDYVKIGWCFVAVKTKVGQKKGADPKPGMRRVNTKLPAGSTFDGHVQAMGFRFKTDKLVVPMRLSTFNEGDLHNIVYVLSDEPQKIRSVPEEYVVRQIPGSDLFRNVTGPLPLRVIGGKVKDIPAWQKKNLKQRRNPVPHNGAARDLFAADMLAIKEQRLSHPHEEKEKMFLRIGEKLGLRGPEIDKLNEGALIDDREKAVKSALKGIESMTLTIVDGNFPREVLANQNLTFADYKMPSRRNTPRFYDAKTKKPASTPNGIRTLGVVSQADVIEPLKPAETRKAGLLGMLLPFAFVLIGGICLTHKRRAVAAVLAAAVVFGVPHTEVHAAQKPETKPAKAPSILELIDQLKDPKKASAASEALIKHGKKAIPDLIGEAIEGNDLSMRGWAIVCLSEIGGKEAADRLLEMQNDPKQPQLVRTWAAAGRVHMATTSKELLELATLIPQFPALGRPVGMKLVAKLKAKGEKVTAEDLLGVTIRVRQLQAPLAPAILAVGSDSLVKSMRSSKNQQIRRQAAAYLATLANQGEDSVAGAVVKAYQFDPKAKSAAVRDAAQPVRRPPVVRPAVVRPRVAAVQIPAGTNALILADRRTIQRLSLAKKLLTQKDYLQAVGLLQKVIEREKDAFYYPDPTKRDSIQSVRNSAQRMIGGMPKAGKEAYKLKFGGTAKALLAEAETAGNFQKIAEIARRYFHTDAGFSAMYRLGLLHYDQGRPLAAALCFERLRGRPDAEAKWEPVLSLRAAVCWHRAGIPKKVADALETVRKTAAGKPVVIGGQPVALFANPDGGAAWLARNFGSAGLPDRIADSDWTMFRGDRARNAVVRLPEQASNRKWRKTLIPDPTTDFYDARPDPAQSQTATRTQLGSAVASMANQFQQQQWNVFPSTHPVAVGNTLLTRTVSGLRAIDVQTGKALWESFPDELLETLVTADGKQPIPSSTSHIRQLVGQRVWGDMTWGGLSTNGELVYCIEDVALQYPVRVPTDNPRTFKTLTADRRVNRLVAYSVRSNRRVWSIGGPAADLEPNDFAGTFFLGSPIQLAGRLYGLVEVSGEVRLHAYELKSPGSRVPPELVWSQPLIGANQRIDNDRRRRIAGTTISYADGILVCPTDAGYVIAVDGGGASPRPDAPDSLEFAKTQGDFTDDSTGDDYEGPASDEHWEDADEIVQIESRYEIGHRLGRGGMGDVHFAVDRRLKRQVAIKTLRDDLEHSRKAGRRFLIEAQAIAQLNHFNIVQVYDFGRSPEGFFLVMELVDGDSLAGLLQKNGSMQVVEAVELIMQICDALSLAHERGMVHRDIKPGNILVTKSGVAKLSDFGLARLDAGTGTPGQTQAGTTLGTIDFMAPEQHHDPHNVDARSDLFSLGATLYQMVTGSSPRIIRSNQIPEEIQSVILTTLEDDPQQRYQTAEELRLALEDIVGRKRISKTEGAGQPGECRECRRVNGAGMKFCQGCGASLVEPCLSCGTPLSAWTQFCGQCGKNSGELIDAKVDELENERRQLGKLLGSYQFDEAKARLKTVRELTHPRLREYADWAAKQLPDVERRRAEQMEWATQQLQSARAAIQEDAAYSRAIQLLEQVPDSLRTSEMFRLLESSRDCHYELQQLAETIRAATSQRRYDGLLPTVERFIELKPNHKKSRKLAENLRRRERSRGGRRRNYAAIPVPAPRQKRSGRGRYSGQNTRSAGGGRIAEEVRRHCSRLSQNGYYVGNNIPEKKLSNAVMSYGIPATAEVIALIDCTVFGSAKDGLAICDDGLYWHNQFESAHRLEWDDFVEAQLQAQGVFQIQFGRFGNFNTAGGSCGRTWILSMLTQLQSVVKRVGPAAGVAAATRFLETPAEPEFGNESSVILSVVDEGPSYDDLLKFCSRYKANGYTVGSAIPADKLNNARESYKIPSQDFVVALLDCTVFGGARDGLAVCASGLYWHNQFESACNISWDDLAEAEIDKKGIFLVQIGTHGNFSTAGSDAGRKWALDFIRQLQLPQYKFGKIVIPPASAAEPKRKTVSVKLATDYVENAALAWSKSRKCVTCHTNGTYMLIRPALTAELGPPSEEIRKFFIAQSAKAKAAGVKRLQSGIRPTQVAYIAAGLAEWDARITKKTSKETVAALKLMLSVQSKDGSWGNADCWPPHESSDYHGATVAATALATAPGWLKTVKDKKTLQSIARLQSYLKKTTPPHDYGKLLLLWASTRMKSLVDDKKRAELIETVWKHQRADGGWSIRTFAKPETWGRGNRARKLRKEPEFKNPPSDGHMTGLAVIVLREAGIPANDPRLKKAVQWLLANQRTSGRWWTRSLNNDRYHFITYSGTLYPLLALAKCDALPKLEPTATETSSPAASDSATRR
eukprot:g8360.t1